MVKDGQGLSLRPQFVVVITPMGTEGDLGGLEGRGGWGVKGVQLAPWYHLLGQFVISSEKNLVLVLILRKSILSNIYQNGI